MTRLFIINGKYFAQAPIPNPECFHPQYIWYCYSCGEVYARLPTQPGKEDWRAQMGCCEKCNREHPTRQLPGSIWDINNQDYNSQLPREVLERELAIAEKYYEEAIGNDS